MPVDVEYASIPMAKPNYNISKKLRDKSWQKNVTIESPNCICISLSIKETVSINTSRDVSTSVASEAFSLVVQRSIEV